MKAIYVEQAGGPEVLELKDVPDPAPGAGQVLVRVKAAGVNPFEGYMRAGWYPGTRFPFIPGVDGAGIVEAVGEGVTRLKPGDRVWFAGAAGGSYAEKAVANEATVHPLPEQFAFAQGAALGVPYGTSYHGLFQRGNAIAGETVLIHGASGGVGLAGVEWAAAAGLTVIGTASTDRGRALAAEHGAKHVFDHSKPNYLDQIREVTGGGVDLVLEMAAHANLGKDLTILKKFGRVVVIGCKGAVEIDPRITMGNQLSILGLSLNNTTPEQLARIHADIGKGLVNGTLNPVVGREFTLADAPAAQAAIEGSGAYGKIVLVP